MTKLAPARTGGLIMGVWFLSMSVGDYIGGRLSSLYESLPLPSLFGLVAAFCLVVGAALIALLRPMRKLMGDIN
jgi:POT family proton-dependent oligopeptide transporter